MKCIAYNYPETDNLDFLFILVPNDVKQFAFDYYSRYFGTYTPYGEKRIMDKLPDIHTNYIKKFDRAHEDNNGVIRVQIQIDATSHGRYQRNKSIFSAPLIFHKPVIKKGITETVGEICISNMSRDMIRFIYDVIPFSTFNDEEEESENVVDVEKLKEKVIKTSDHLTPVEKEFKKILATGKRITTTMNVMEKSEKRMRRTSEGTSKRVHVFSYASICILLLTSFLQVRYLKSFFHKKKLI